jgi:hypothetical protein
LEIRSILFICFNITLVNYTRRLLAEKGIPLGRDGVQVKPFYELCSEIIGDRSNTADKIGQVVEAARCPHSGIAVIYTLKNLDQAGEPLLKKTL